MLRYTADLRTLAYIAFTVALAVFQWHLGFSHFHPALYALSLLMAVTLAVVSHNHNHLGMWKWRPGNTLTSYVINMFYGHPAIGWVPTHNQVHHKLNNKEGDSSRSPKFFRSNHLLALLVYPMLTGIEQTADIKAFFKALWKKDRRAFWTGISEYIVYAGMMGVLLVLDWKKTLVFLFIPQQFALTMIQVFNYVQHVEADAYSPWNHSRNFVSPVLNALLFNNGYHTVHHQKPGLHWSLTPKAHAEVTPNIHPALLVESWWGYMTSTYLLRPFIPGAKAPVLTEMKPSPKTPTMPSAPSPGAQHVQIAS